VVINKYNNQKTITTARYQLDAMLSPQVSLELSVWQNLFRFTHKLRQADERWRSFKNHHQNKLKQKNKKL